MIVAALAAARKVPLIMVSGDDQLEKEVRRFLPWVRYATVKRAVDRSNAEAFSREEVSRRIETAAREALQKLTEARLPDWPGPYRFTLTFQDESQASAAAMVGGAVSAGARAVQVRTDQFDEGYRASQRLISVAHLVSWSTAQEAALKSLPASLRVRVTELWYDRFLGRMLAAPSANAQSSGALPRHWGAR
jgi:D-aminopeptidase